MSLPIIKVEKEEGKTERVSKVEVSSPLATLKRSLIFVE